MAASAISLQMASYSGQRFNVDITNCSDFVFCFFFLKEYLDINVAPFSIYVDGKLQEVNTSSNFPEQFLSLQFRIMQDFIEVNSTNFVCLL